MTKRVRKQNIVVLFFLNDFSLEANTGYEHIGIVLLPTLEYGHGNPVLCQRCIWAVEALLPSKTHHHLTITNTSLLQSVSETSVIEILWTFSIAKYSYLSM